MDGRLMLGNCTVSKPLISDRGIHASSESIDDLVIKELQYHCKMDRTTDRLECATTRSGSTLH